MSPARGRAELASSRGRIHAAALRLFARHGYEGVSLQRIADEAGLHKSSLFHYYRSKVELVFEVFEDQIERLLGRLEPLRREPPTLETLLGVVDDLVDFFADEPEGARLLMGFIFASEDSDLKVPVSSTEGHPVQRLFLTLTTWLERARAAGAIRHVPIRQTLYNLIGLVLFHPAAVAEEAAAGGRDPASGRARRVRKEELRTWVRGALAPPPSDPAAR